MNLTNIFLDSAPSRYRLNFGVSENVMLRKISNDIKRDKTGAKINKSCYMTFVQVDPKKNNEAIAESTFSYFNITIDKASFAVNNFTHQVNQLIQIILAVVPEDKVKEVIGAINKVAVDNKDVFSEVARVDEADAKLTKKLIAVQEALNDAFKTAMDPFTGENGDLVDLVAVTNNKGAFQELPREDKGFITKHGVKKLTVDHKYLRWVRNKDTKSTDTSDNIGKEEVIEEELVIGDDQGLNEIL